MPYPRQRSNVWFVKRWPYRVHMLSELSSVFLVGYTVVLVLLAAKVHDGDRAFTDYADTLGSPVLVGFHILALAFALLHTVTWLRAVPVALPLRGEQKALAPRLVGAAYAAMFVASGLILVLVLS